MEMTDDLQKRLSAILPERSAPISLNVSPETRESAIKKEAHKLKSEDIAKKVLKQKQLEVARQKKLEKKRAEIENSPSIADQIEAQKLQKAAQECKKSAEELDLAKAEIIETDPLDVTPLVEKADVITEKMERMIQLQGTSRPEMRKLLSSLNINMSVQLTKSDTANLLACLLTCNESQLQALLSNKKLPIVIKTVIKRLMDDMKLGNIETIEKLWDRVFGKGQMQLDLPEKQQLQTGILPDMPISREAYVIIRDTLIK